MSSLIEELRRREATARAEVDRLRSRIEELAEDLARAEEQGLAPGDRPGGSNAGAGRAGRRARGETAAGLADRGG